MNMVSIALFRGLKVEVVGQQCGKKEVRDMFKAYCIRRVAREEHHGVQPERTVDCCSPVDELVEGSLPGCSAVWRTFDQCCPHIRVNEAHIQRDQHRRMGCPRL